MALSVPRTAPGPGCGRRSEDFPRQCSALLSFPWPWASFQPATKGSAVVEGSETAAQGGHRVRTPVVDQHATWIAVNPIQGCPKACEYCFLNERGQTAVRPEHLATPAQTVGLLLTSSYYAPSRPVALYTWTDVMALPDSRAHLAELLDALASRGVPNPIVLITKCHVPDETIENLAAARERGLGVVVYVSYSGLGREVERGIRHEATAANFPRLAEAGIPVVHYWRPAFPESATPEIMQGVLDHVAAYARCTVAAGLKVETAAVGRLSKFWPQLADAPKVSEAECVYPRPFWEFIHKTWRYYPDYPVFHTNSCALSYVLGQADSFGVFGSRVCRVRNLCPVAQREVCTRAEATRTPPSPDRIRAALVARGAGEVPFALVDGGRELVVDAALDTRVAAAVTQDLGVRLRARRNNGDAYWSSGTAGAEPVILG